MDSNLGSIYIEIGKHIFPMRKGMLYKPKSTSFQHEKDSFPKWNATLFIFNSLALWCQNDIVP